MEENTLRQVEKAIGVFENLKDTQRKAEDEYKESLARIGMGEFRLMECAIAEKKVMKIIDAILLTRLPDTEYDLFKRLKDIVVGY